MKIRILTVVAVALLLLGFNVSAANYEYSLSLDAGFTSASCGDDLTEISDKLNMTTADLNSYFNKNGLLYLAVSDDTKTQIRLSAFTDNFSSTVGDISNLDSNGLAEFKTSVGASSPNSDYAVSADGRKFVTVKTTLNDSGGTYTVTQYITICSNQTFFLSCYNEGDDTSEQVQAVFESFLLKSKVEEKHKPNHLDILIASGILLFSVLAVIMIIGIAKSILKKQKGK